VATLPPLEFSFASIEAALIRAYGVAAADHGRFRAKLTFLQKNGLFGDDRPGKGQRQTYRPDHLHRLVFCFELAELGAPPAVQLKLVAELWERHIERIFRKADALSARGASGDDVVLLMAGVSLMVEAWTTGAVPNVQHCPLREVANRVGLALQASGDTEDALQPRILAVNLTARLRRFHNALAAVHLKFEQPPVQSLDSVSRQRHEPSPVQASRRRARRKKRAGDRRRR
jgi:hypothetical protein